MSGRRSRPVRVARGALWALAGAHLVEAAVLRYQRRQLTALPKTPADVPAGADGDGMAVLSAGAPIDDATRRAAATLVGDGVEVVDLLPGSVTADRLLRVLRRTDLARLADDVLYAPGGASEALVVGGDAADRAALASRDHVERGELVRLTVEAQRSTRAGRTIRLAPTLPPTPWTPHDRWRELQELCAFSRPIVDLAPVAVALETAHLAALTAGLVVAPGPAAAALVTWSAQPLLALAGAADEPVGDGDGGGADRASGALAAAGAGRLLQRWRENLAAWRAYAEVRRVVPGDEAGPPPVAQRFEARAETCPWCGSSSLAPRVDGLDLNQFKPGVFHVDECTSCGHVFQNPRLAPEGLGYYYADVYDDFGEEMLEFGLSTAGKRRIYEGRVEAVAAALGDGAPAPAAWLDVGTGHGHFCLVARRRWPRTTFDGLDQSAAVVAAERRGRIDTAHIGQFPELAGKLTGAYDVVSMNHYLEHTVDPRAELAAAARVLRPGGVLLVEVPDPDSPWSRLLGRYWICWLQPQHLHFMPCANLVRALGEHGFDVISIQRGEAGEGYDLTSAASLLAQHLAGPGSLPWLPRPSLTARVRRAVVLTAAAPVLAAAALADVVKDARTRQPGALEAGTAYRIVARRAAASSAPPA